MQTPLASFDAQDLKLVYRVLHGSLLEHVDLMDSDFLEALQTWLQTIAQSEGVDVGDHGQWDAWLGNRAVACADRVGQSRRLTLL